MKAKLTGKIVSFEKDGGDTTIVFEANGKVDTRNVAAQPTDLHATLTLKSLVSDQMRLGSVITVTVSDEETNDGSGS